MKLKKKIKRITKNRKKAKTINKEVRQTNLKVWQKN
jgi:hypothetical protein